MMSLPTRPRATGTTALQLLQMLLDRASSSVDDVKGKTFVLTTTDKGVVCLEVCQGQRQLVGVAR